MKHLRSILIGAAILIASSRTFAQQKPTDQPPGDAPRDARAHPRPVIEKQIVDPSPDAKAIDSAAGGEKALEHVAAEAATPNVQEPARTPPQRERAPWNAHALQQLLSAWGARPAAHANDRSDFNKDGVVDSSDLMAMLAGQAPPVDGSSIIRTCDTEPGPDSVIHTRDGIAGDGGGMNGNGWDGAGQEDWVLSWHVDNTTPDFSASAQRSALITAMQAWASVVQVSFTEYPVGDLNDQVDWTFYTGNHCAAEPAECGDADCPFNGPGGVLAHAAFPPGAGSTCGGTMAETHAGNVHFDEDETWQQNAGNDGSFSFTLIACHEVGHSLGLIHSTGAADVMRASFNGNDAYVGLSQNDIDNIRLGYGAGSGVVTTLEQTGVWVNHNNAGGVQFGTFNAPFATVPQGVNGVPPGNFGVTLHIQAGVYPQTVFADKPMIMKAENGTVRIGG